MTVPTPSPRRRVSVPRRLRRVAGAPFALAVAGVAVIALTAVGLAPRSDAVGGSTPGPARPTSGAATLSSHRVHTPDRPGTPPTPAPAVTATPAAPDAMQGTSSSSPSLALPQKPWWGGPSYYARFSKAAAAGWASPSFFPIAVFYGKPEHAGTLASLGINTYMGAEYDGSPISTMTDQGISVIAQGEWTAAEVGENPRVVGWHASDECEMGEGSCAGGDEFSRLAQQAAFVAPFRARSDGRFVQANFGNGVLGTWWAPTTMDDQVGLVDVTSVDKYAYTSPPVGELLRNSPTWPTGRNPRSAGAYGWLQDRMATFSSPAASKPNWVFVETAKPFLTEPEASTITPDQIRGAVWNAIIHGAAGIAYFQHNNSGCGTYSLIQCSAALQDSVRATNAEVRTLAPVINSPSFEWSFGPGLDTALKTSGSSAYIFAMTDGGTGTRSFALPPGIRGSEVEVVGENRRIPVSGGSFSDSFAQESTHRVYRIALG